MTTIRVMTYNVGRCRGGDGRTDPERILRVIGYGAPDIVALQEIDAEQLDFLARHLGMRQYGGDRPGGCAFLSFYPLKGLREYQLGASGTCLRADADIAGKRLHLFGVALDRAPGSRLHQINSLLGPDLLGDPRVVCPSLVLGDFAHLFWAPGNIRLNLFLRQSPRLLWNATYPARFPLVSRDRAYLRGDLRVVDSRILRFAQARHAASHLPLVLTLQLIDPRTYLQVEKLGGGRMEIAPG